MTTPGSEAPAERVSRSQEAGPPPPPPQVPETIQRAHHHAHGASGPSEGASRAGAELHGGGGPDALRGSEQSRRWVGPRGAEKPPDSAICRCVEYELPRWLRGREAACQCRRCQLDPGSGRPPGGGHGNRSRVPAWRSP